MRPALTAAFFALLLAGCAGPQQTAGINDSAAAAETDAIRVQTAMEADVAYRGVAQVLQSQGYALESTDETLRSITTGYHGISQRYGVDHVFAQLNASVQGEENATITLRGKWRTGEEDGSGQTVKKYGQNGSPAREAWKAMHQVAEAIGGEVTYQ